ncbi:N-acetyltransferase family protein [Candidatus Rariloculus sp.]|uniref:GNAT family N-acetyltransferase n=1 Tax=Candidatus Rariloculus sp. TaxID=3101265 RepID=UPI003D0FAE58
MDAVRVREADLTSSADAHGIIEVLDSYASDPIGDGEPLSEAVRERLIPALRDHPTTLVLLAVLDGRPIGVAACFFGFSTFRARPLLNIHDLAVLPEYRGNGIGRLLLGDAEKRARQRGCCKLTLEVRTDNNRARKLYERLGFQTTVGGDSAQMLFLNKPLAAAARPASE